MPELKNQTTIRIVIYEGRSHATERGLKYTASVPQPLEKVFLFKSEAVGRWFPVSRIGSHGSDFTLLGKLLPAVVHRTAG